MKKENPTIGYQKGTNVKTQEVKVKGQKNIYHVNNMHFKRLYEYTNNNKKQRPQVKE